MKKILTLLLLMPVIFMCSSNKGVPKEKVISESEGYIDGNYVWQKTVELPDDTIPVKKKKGKEFNYPKPLYDSSWSYAECDTLHGLVEISVDNGMIKGEGIVTSCRQWECSKNVYSAKDQAAIDSFQNASMVWWGNGGCSSFGDPRKTAYLKLKSGYQRIEGQFTFTPK